MSTIQGATLQTEGTLVYILSSAWRILNELPHEISASRYSLSQEFLPPEHGTEMIFTPASTLASTQQGDTRQQGPFAKFLPVLPVVQQRANQVYLSSKLDERVSGTYAIDPTITSRTLTSFNPKSPQWEAWQTHRKHFKRAFGSDQIATPGADQARLGEPTLLGLNAAFITQHGEIILDLSVVGTTSDRQRVVPKTEKIQAHISVSSRFGAVKMNLFDVHTHRCVNLDIHAPHDGIIVFLPQTFDGPIAFHTRRGREGIDLLPEMSKRASVVRVSGREMIVVVSSSGPHRELPTMSNSQLYLRPGDNSAMIGTVGGMITVGIGGMDRLWSQKSPNLGYIRRLGVRIGNRLSMIVRARPKGDERKTDRSHEGEHTSPLEVVNRRLR
ncbi:hypothetical protein CERSUDRAFT_93390 [Gelatoporia subvermispora B]|uniref:DUF7330 domain-containing protein n=1 Tax=Ceriporiopsis subvermispora (strain B) TaxID=914234 RepID=M2R481_CERS8|nr:hypothetical protein CERSUDRAFT_93390 [Gelatoporia subvermispora B]